MKMPGESEKLERFRRLVSKNIIEYILKHKGTEDLEHRMAAIEQRLDERNG